jgi:predicted O-methyltransferase YrrM
METLDELYAEARDRPSDIHQHLDTFVGLVRKLDATQVIELGVRAAVSTIAWLYGLEQTDGHLWSVDIHSPSRWLGVQPRWTFVLGDDLADDVLHRMPKGVDIVFIDTSHAYEHTLRELTHYTQRVRPGGVVVLHDTEVEWPETVPMEVQYPVKTAITEYCTTMAYTWENHPHNNGLGIIYLPD